MFWFIDLPILVTSLTLAAAVIAATVTAPRFRWRRGRVFGWGMLLAMVAFVPSCTVVMTAANAVRFGVSRYENYDAIWEPKFKQWLPEEATDIVMNRRINGYEARFRIDRAALDRWFDRCGTNAKGTTNTQTEPAVARFFGAEDAEELERGFGADGNWQPSADAKWINFVGPQWSKAAGTWIHFDEKSGIAYQSSVFW
jgi:hypothetical protein